MISSKADLRMLDERMGIAREHYRPLFISRLYTGPRKSDGLSLTGPVVGAPYAVMLMETLFAWGARRFLFWGWCGAVSPQVRIGDVVFPNAAHIDEGTSRHYGAKSDVAVSPSPRWARPIQTELDKCGVRFHTGSVWSTDAIYRETREKVDAYKSKGVLAVEMEVSALFTVGHYRGLSVDAFLVVSDELSRDRWEPGFGDERFVNSRRVLGDILVNLWRPI